jgi:abnormal spindle-like microcephaly-associated protein
MRMRVSPWLRDLASSTQWSAVCRRSATDPRALQALLRTVRQCDRSEAHSPILAAAYALFEFLSAGAYTRPLFSST